MTAYLNSICDIAILILKRLVDISEAKLATSSEVYEISFFIFRPLGIFVSFKKLIEKHNVIRLSHNQEHAIEHEGTQDLEKMSRRYSFLLPDQLKLYMAYENHLSFGYITSDIYATQLFKYYQEDPKTALMYIKGIIDGEKSIKELLKHYNIALNNPETFATYNKRLDNIPKI